MRHSLATGIAFLALALSAGCARDRGAGPQTQPAAQPATAAETTPQPQPEASAAKSPPAQAAPPADEPARSAQQTVKPLPAQPAPRAATPPPGQPVPQAATPKPPSLDLSSLEQRLRETNAIGALTKIALKNQVDDLLDQFRTYYQGKLKTDLTMLRRSYDLLLLKVVALLQDDDKPLANAIVASREEIWGILSDRTKFASL